MLAFVVAAVVVVVVVVSFDAEDALLLLDLLTDDLDTWRLVLLVTTVDWLLVPPFLFSADLHSVTSDFITTGELCLLTSDLMDP